MSIGGRGTRGGVYRISYDKATANPKPLPIAKRLLDFDKDAAKQWLADCKSDDLHQRRIAMEMILRWWDRADWGKKLGAAVEPNLSHYDRHLRRLSGRIGNAWYVDIKAPTREAGLTLAMEQARDEPARALKVAIEALDNSLITREQLTALRIVQLVYGDLTAKDAVGTVWEGYTFRDPVPKLEADALRKHLGALTDRVADQEGKRDVQFEIARVRAALGGEAGVFPIHATLDNITPKSPAADDFHYLIAFARMSENVNASRTVRSRTRSSLCSPR